MLFARSERHAGSPPTRRAFQFWGATFLTAVVAINITAIDAPKPSDLAIVGDRPKSTQARSGAPRDAVGGRPIVNQTPTRARTFF